MAVIQNITLDVNRPNIFYYINEKQSDGGRQLKISITVDGIPYEIPSSATVKFRAIKPDNTVVYDSGTVNSDGTCTVVLTTATLSVIGKIFADVSILYGSRTVSSVSFIIMNRELPVNISGITSTSEYSSLSSFVSNTSSYDSLLLNKAIGPGLTASLADDILTVVKST